MARRPIAVWGRRSSFHTRKAIWALDELGLAFSLTEAGFGIEPTEALLRRNPGGLVPVIDDAGTVVWESNVIVRYLYGRYGAPPQSEDTFATRIAAEQWMDWNATTLWPALRPLHQAAARGGALLPGDRRVAEERTHRWLDVLETALAHRPYLGGESFGMGDIPAALSVERAAGLDFLGERTNLSRWLAQLVTRPAFPPDSGPQRFSTKTVPAE